jgi:hypothetical protein
MPCTKLHRRQIRYKSSVFQQKQAISDVEERRRISGGDERDPARLRVRSGDEPSDARACHRIQPDKRIIEEAHLGA